MLLALSPSACDAATAGCDFSCAECSLAYTVTAEPCDSSDPSQYGWALGPSRAGLRSITYSGDGRSHRCVGWNPLAKQMQLQACAAENGESWVNRSSYSCQQWNVTNGSYPSSGFFSGYISASDGCANNEGNQNGCLDIHSKLGPSLQLTRCYGQPNDFFSLPVSAGSAGRWVSQEKLPMYPQRCMAVREKVCSFAGCCTVCAEGFERSSDGFCLQKQAKPAPGRKAFVFLAIPNNSTAVDDALSELAKHRSSFTGVVFQYFGICGAKAAKGYCSPQESIGPAHLAASYPAGVPHDIAERIRHRLGSDTETIALISYGGTSNISLLQELFTNQSLAQQFAEDALQEAKRQALTGYQFDFEPTQLDWFQNATGFISKFSAVLSGHGLHVGWDGNGPEGVPFNVSTWMDMGTYYGGGGYLVNMLQGVYAVGLDRFGLGYCPTCQQLKEEEVEERFASLKT